MNDYQHPVNLNLNVRGLPVSATLAINELSNQLIRDGKKIYKLGLGQSPFPVEKSVVEALKANAHQKNYLPVKGLDPLRETVADYYNKTQKLDFKKEDILIGPGSKELMFLMQLVHHGDLLVPSPSWVSYAPQAKILGHNVFWIETDSKNKWILSPDALDQLCVKDKSRPRIIIINYPNNPTGYSYDLDTLKDIAHIARKYGVIILSDEIYGELEYKGRHVSIAQFYPEGTIISGGLSKWCGAGGWRLGVFAFPSKLKWLLDAMASVASETFTSTSAPIQHAAVTAYTGGPHIDQYLQQSRRILDALSTYAVNILRSTGIEIEYPDGGFYLFPDFSNLRDKIEKNNIYNSEDLCSKILEDIGVAMLPGTMFGRPKKELSLRISCVDFDGTKALAAAQHTASDKSLNDNFLNRYCCNVTKAISKIKNWLEK